MATVTKDLLLRNVPAESAKALKRAAVELEQPMGQVFAGLVDRMLGLYVALHREPEDLTPEETEALGQTVREIARGRYRRWEELRRELGFARTL